MGAHPLVEEGQVLPLVSTEISRNVDALTAYDLWAQQYLLGHCGCQATQEVTAATQHFHNYLLKTMEHF